MSFIRELQEGENVLKMCSIIFIVDTVLSNLNLQTSQDKIRLPESILSRG